MPVVSSTPRLQEAVEALVAAVRSRLATMTETFVMVIDGGSGAGKSILASEVAKRVGATVIQCDDFFAATVTDAEWDSLTPELRWRRCIDWQRMRAEVLRPLLAGQLAQYRPYSFATGDGLSTHWVKKEPAQVIILDGIYSANPGISDLVHLSVLVDVSPEVRRCRHNLREGSEDLEWHARWDPAEQYYLTTVRHPASFDLVVSI